MPIETKEMDGGLGLEILGSGTITNDEFLGFYRALLADDGAGLAGYRFSITDWTRVETAELSAASIARVTRLLVEASSVAPRSIVAIVADREATFGIARMAELLMDQAAWNTRAFRTRDEAAAWVRETARERFGLEDLKLA